MEDILYVRKRKINIIYLGNAKRWKYEKNKFFNKERLKMKK